MGRRRDPNGCPPFEIPSDARGRNHLADITLATWSARGAAVEPEQGIDERGQAGRVAAGCRAVERAHGGSFHVADHTPRRIRAARHLSGGRAVPAGRGIYLGKIHAQPPDHSHQMAIPARAMDDHGAGQQGQRGDVERRAASAGVEPLGVRGRRVRARARPGGSRRPTAGRRGARSDRASTASRHGVGRQRGEGLEVGRAAGVVEAGVRDRPRRCASAIGSHWEASMRSG